MANVLNTHPEYLQNYDQWLLSKDLYDGNHRVLTGNSAYLWMHAIEEKSATDLASSEIRARRELRTRYLNLSEIIVSLWTSLFFKKEPRLDKSLEKLLAGHDGARNIDGRGTSLASFFRNKILPSYLLYGKVILVVDSLPIEARNLGDEIRAGQRPFLDIIEPLDFKDWSRNTSDPAKITDFTFGRHEFIGVMPRASSSEIPVVRRFSYEYRLEGGAVSLYISYLDLDKNYKVKENQLDKETRTEQWQSQGEPILLNKLERVPLSVVEDESWLKNVDQEILRHFNARSNRDNINYTQGYDEKYLKINGGAISADRLKAFNEYTRVILNTDEDAMKLDPVDPAALERMESEAIRNVFRVGLNRLHMLPDASQESPSAESLDKAGEYTSDLVEAALGDIEDIANQAFKDYAAYLGQKNFDGKIQLDKEVSEESFDEFITVWQAFGDRLSKYEKISKATDKKALHKLGLPRDEMPELEKEIDEGPGETTTDQGQAIQDPLDRILNAGQSNETPPNNAAENVGNAG